MVRIATSFLGAAVAFSYALAAPAMRRQEDIVPLVPGAAGGEEGLNPIDTGAIPSVELNGSLGNSVEIPTETAPVPPVSETPPVGTPPVETPPVLETPPVAIPTSIPPVVHTSVPSWPQYGSGSVPWQVNYNDCVQTCFASHAQPTVVMIPPQGHVSVPSHGGVVAQPSGGEIAPQVGGNGVLHNIMVEPLAGVLKFTPAFVKANIGDTLHFVVVNGQHQIVQSTPVTPCNATVGGFDSGIITAGGTFDTVVQSTDPTFFYANGECAQGMFGAVNAATGLEDSETTVNALMPKWAEQNPDLNAVLSATNSLAAQTQGLNWAGKIDTKDIPSELYPQLAETVLFSRAVMAYNPDMFDTNGQFNPSNEVFVPGDFTNLLAIANAGGLPDKDIVADVPAGAEVPTGAANVAAAAPTDESTTDGAGSIVSSRVAYAAVAFIGALFML